MAGNPVIRAVFARARTRATTDPPASIRLLIGHNPSHVVRMVEVQTGRPIQSAGARPRVRVSNGDTQRTTPRSRCSTMSVTFSAKRRYLCPEAANARYRAMTCAWA